eukprot:TRINITY_DN4617_c0_g1_i1.p1 TRINITY_DN4617_c0_g1~~TRINITY_DN4617_c0_g1_i1.p1  ORF type:complete len:425 (-),score=34.05 TRINITY_DN4617_c0_g1_i1:173-1447(-)
MASSKEIVLFCLYGIYYLAFLIPPMVAILRRNFMSTDLLRLAKHPRRATFFFLILALLLVPGGILISYHIRDHDHHSWTIGWFLADFAPLCAFIAIPTALALTRPVARAPCDLLHDCLIVIILLAPLHVNILFPNLVPDFVVPIDADQWNWPPFSMVHATALILCLFIFLVIRPLRYIGVHFSWTPRDFIVLLLGTIVCAGLEIGLASIARSYHGLQYLPSLSTGIIEFILLYFLVALPFELYFRGVIQNMVHTRLDFEACAREYSDSSRPLRDEPSVDSASISSSVTSYSSFTHPLPNSRPKLVVSNENEDDFDGDEEEGDFKSLSKDKSTFWLYHQRDWVAVLFASSIASVLVVVTSLHDDALKTSIPNRGLLFGVSFILSFCCGWIWKLTNKITVSAVLTTLACFFAPRLFELQPTGYWQR